MKIRITRRAYRVCTFCRMRRNAMRLYVALHTLEDGY